MDTCTKCVVANVLLFMKRANFPLLRNTLSKMSETEFVSGEASTLRTLLFKYMDLSTFKQTKCNDGRKTFTNVTQ